jgi:SAM-dependent methyltransferase
MSIKTGLLADPRLYHHLRQLLTGGMPFRRWVRLYGLADPGERVADIGCGPADILRYLDPSSLPGHYLGLDLSSRYLEVAEARARDLSLPSTFVRIDLDRLPTDAAVQRELADLLEEHRITRVLLLGVLHHIADDAAVATLDLAHAVSSVRSVLTSDVVYLPDETLNNLLCDWDRGGHVREEGEYDALVGRSAWPSASKTVTHPGFSFITYLHYQLSKDPLPAAPEAGRRARSSGAR